MYQEERALCQKVKRDKGGYQQEKDEAQQEQEKALRSPQDSELLFQTSHRS